MLLWSAEGGSGSHKGFAQLGCWRAADDQINNLNWRLRNGELPHTTPRVAVVLIGTNDVGAVEGCTRSEPDLLAAVPVINSRHSPPHTTAQS